MTSSPNWTELLARLEADLQARKGDATAADEDAWQTLAQVLSHQAGVLRASYSDLQTQDIEDLVHDVLLKLQSTDAMRRLRAARSVEGYLFVTLRNAATDLLRRKSKVLIGGDILESLDDEDRQLFEKRFSQNMSIADIATDTNTSYSFVAAKLFKMLSRLRLQLTDIERHIYYKERFQQLPMKTILKDFTQEELELLELNIVEERNAEEIAELLNRDVNVVRVELNALWAKLRYRARNVLKKTPKMF